MIQYVVDLDMCVAEPGAWDEQVVVAVTAASRTRAASIALALAHQIYQPHEAIVRAVEILAPPNELFDVDWRERSVMIGSA